MARNFESPSRTSNMNGGKPQVSDELPDWCFKSVDSPSAMCLQSDAGMIKAIEDIYHDTLAKHGIMEQYQGIRADGPGRLIRRICGETIRKLRVDGVRGVPSMTAMIDCIANHPEYTLYKSDHTIRMACESAVINCLWKYVRHPDHIDTPAELLKKWNNFEKERSHWWRARKAAETSEHVRMKWEALLADIHNLLNFHNALNHTKDLLDKPTLKHTLHLAALTAEGRIFENGQGRSIASECRHILVRKACDIPIKSRPDKKASGSGAGSRKTAAPGSLRQSVYVMPNPRGGKMLTEPYESIPGTHESASGILGAAHEGTFSKRQRTDTSNPFRDMPESLRADALSLLNFKNNSPRSADDSALLDDTKPSSGEQGSHLSTKPIPEAGSELERVPMMRSASDDWPLKRDEPAPSVDSHVFGGKTQALAQPPLLRGNSDSWDLKGPPEEAPIVVGMETTFLNQTSS